MYRVQDAGAGCRIQVPCLTHNASGRQGKFNAWRRARRHVSGLLSLGVVRGCRWLAQLLAMRNGRWRLQEAQLARAAHLISQALQKKHVLPALSAGCSGFGAADSSMHTYSVSEYA